MRPAALIPALWLALVGSAAPVQEGDTLTRILACDLPFSEVTRMTHLVPELSVRDDSTPGTLDRTFYYPTRGVTVMGGIPIRSAARGDFFDKTMIEIAYAVRLNGSFDEMSAQLLRHYRAAKCRDTVSPRGDQVCLLHLRTEPNNGVPIDVDVQISAFEGRIQFECLYSTKGH